MNYFFLEKLRILKKKEKGLEIFTFEKIFLEVIEMRLSKKSPQKFF